MSDVALPRQQVDPVLVIHRIVQAGLLLTLLWKLEFFSLASRLYADVPVEDPFFPAFFQSVWTVRGAFIMAVVATGWNLVSSNTRAFIGCSLATSISLTVLCVHQASYNDMTFVTAWWTALWALWFTTHMHECDREYLLQKASLLSRLIISVILLGGAAGKWTAEYWSGDVFFDIYFLDRDYWLFNLLRSQFETDTLRQIAMWYSRHVVIVETVAGLGLWLLPSRAASIIAMALLSSIALLSNIYLFSVLATLIALASVGWIASRYDPQVS